MVIHYPPARLRHNSDQPTAITNGLVTTSWSSHTGDIPLGTPTCSARTRGGRQDELDRGATWAIRQLLTDPAATDTAPWSSAQARTWSAPALGYWLSGTTSQPGRHIHPPASRHGAPTPILPIPLPDPSPQPAPAQAA